jgi:hypothetical protein
VVLTSANGQFSLNTTRSSASLTLTGTKATINSQIANIYFMPDWNVLSNISIVWTQKYSGTTYATRTMPVNYASNNTDVKRLIYTTVGTHTYTPTFLEAKYCQVVSGFVGGGQPAGQFGGGNAGELRGGADSTPRALYSFTINGPNATTVWNASSGFAAVTARAGSYQGAVGITIISRDDDNNPSTTDPIIFQRGYGGKNAEGPNLGGQYGTNSYRGETTSISSVPNGSGGYTVYRTEVAGTGGVAVQNFNGGYNFGRGGNGAGNVPNGNPYIRGNNYTFVTMYSGGQSTQLSWGNGGDAPNGAGGCGAAFLIISRRLNSNGV